MAQKRPYTDYDGVMEQLRTGDSLVGSSAAAMSTGTNANASSIVKGQPVYVKADGELDLARANASGTSIVYGVVADDSVAADATANIQLDGPITATTTQWDAIAGTTGGLVPGTIYCVSPDTAGSLVPQNHSWESGEWNCPVLLAKSATEATVIRGERRKYN